MRERPRAPRQRGTTRAVLRNFTRGFLRLPDSEIYTTEYSRTQPRTRRTCRGQIGALLPPSLPPSLRRFAPSNCLLISVSANKSSLGRRRRASPPLHCTAVHRTPPLKRATQSPSLSSFVFPRPLKSPLHSLLRATTWTFLRDRMCSKKSTQARKCSKGNPASFLRYRMFSASSFVSLEVEQTAGCLT